MHDFPYSFDIYTLHIYTGITNIIYMINSGNNRFDISATFLEEMYIYGVKYKKKLVARYKLLIEIRNLATISYTYTYKIALFLGFHLITWFIIISLLTVNINFNKNKFLFASTSINERDCGSLLLKL